MLYFPRGTIHEGYTDETNHSLHITVSVYQHTAYADLLDVLVPKVLKKCVETDVEFREGLPVNYLKALGSVNSQKIDYRRGVVIENVKNLLRKLIDSENDDSITACIDEAADHLGRKLMRDSMPPVMSKGEAERTCKLDGNLLKGGAVVNR